MKTIACVLFFAFATIATAQRFDDSNAIDINVFRGNIMLHSPDLAPVISGHPEGFMLSLTRRTHGNEEWHRVFNYPDYGAYFLYEDFKSDILGKNYAVGAFYNFYFLNRHVILKVAQGVAIASNPYDKVTNFKNAAFGSKILANTDFALTYKKENLIDKLGIQTGLVFAHFSNGRIKSPNSGINTYNFTVGVNYNFENIANKLRDTTALHISFREPVKYNFVLRTGFNDSPIVGSGLQPFYHFSAYADKRLNRISALQFGAELFLTTSDKEYIRYRSIAFPEDHLAADTDFKRVGVFIGHEMFVNRVSLEAQLGFYIYQPAKIDIPVYDRLGIKYYITKKIFTGVSVKTHGFFAEALEVAVGTRL